MPEIQTVESAAQNLASIANMMPPPPSTAPSMFQLPTKFIVNQQLPQQPQQVLDYNPSDIFGVCKDVPEVANMISKGKLPDYYIQVSLVAAGRSRRRGSSGQSPFLPMGIGEYSWDDINAHIKAERPPGKYCAEIKVKMRGTTKFDVEQMKRMEKFIPEHLSGKNYTFDVGGGGGMNGDDPVQKAEDELKVLELNVKKDELEEKVAARKSPPTAPASGLTAAEMRDEIKRERELNELRSELKAAREAAAAPKTDVAGIATAIAAIFAPVLPLLANALKPKDPPPPPPPPDNSLLIAQMNMESEKIKAEMERARQDARERREADERRDKERRESDERRMTEERIRNDKIEAERREESRRQHEMMLKMFEDKSKPKDRALEDRLFDLMSKQNSKSSLKEMAETFSLMKEMVGGFGGNGRERDDDGFDPNNFWGSIGGLIFRGLRENLPNIVPLAQALLANPHARANMAPEDQMAIQRALPAPSHMPPPMQLMPPPVNRPAPPIPPPLAELPMSPNPPPQAGQKTPIIPPVAQVLTPVSSEGTPPPQAPSSATEDLKRALLIDPVKDTREAMQESFRMAVVDIQVARPAPLWIDHALADWPKTVQETFSAYPNGTEALDYMKFILNDNPAYDVFMAEIDKIDGGRYQMLCHIIQLAEAIRAKNPPAAAPAPTGGN